MNSGKQTKYSEKRIAGIKKAAEYARRQQEAVTLFEKLVQDSFGPLL